MPVPDHVPGPGPGPGPSPGQPPHGEPSIRQRFVRIMRVAAAFSIVIAGLAVALVARGQTELHIHMLIATALGIGFTVLLGTGLMTLIFLSNRSGHDADAGAAPVKKDDQ